MSSMLKGFVGVAAAVFLIGVGIAIGGSARSLFGRSADALAGAPAPAFYANAPAPSAAAPMEEEADEKEASPSADRARPLMQKRREVISIVKGGAGMATYGAGGGSLGGMASVTARIAKPESVAAPAAEAAAPSRAWFPETFLFEPLVVTDAAGQATVPVRVPDRLTTWRVLALAHSRAGAQAGAVTSFLGTLPTYVDPVVPGFVVSGDQLRLPVQVVNTTDREVTAALKVQGTGAEISAAGGELRIPANGSRVEYVSVRANAPGKATLRATLGGADAVVRTFDVLPAGRPIETSAGGTLAAPRSLTLTGPADAIAGSERVRLQVFPGGLAVLRSELSAASARPGDAAVAYALLLAGRADGLLRTLGETPDPEAIRGLTLLASQRALRLARAPSVDSAGLLAEAALSHPGNAVLERLGQRLAQQVASGQRDDGTFQGGDGWTLQRLLVATADGAAAVRADGSSPAGKRRAAAAQIRAEGAFERNLSRIQDGYTAAAVLASGAVRSTGMVETLRAQVREAISAEVDGARSLKLEPDVTRADGERPPAAEAVALAVLALQGDPKAPLADLGAFLLAQYRPGFGWGDGRTNLACLRAVLALFKSPLPEKVQVRLQRDGTTVTEGTFDAKALRDLLTLEAPAGGSGGAHRWTVIAEPAVPGLGFFLQLQSWVPWKAEPVPGLELSLTVAPEAKVGQPVDVEVAARLPEGMTAEVHHALPAGVQPDRASLDALVSAGTLRGYSAADGMLTLEVPAQSAGQRFEARYRLIPTLGGTLHASASTLTVDGRPDVFHLPPTTWAVR